MFGSYKQHSAPEIHLALLIASFSINRSPCRSLPETQVGLSSPWSVPYVALRRSSSYKWCLGSKWRKVTSYCHPADPLIVMWYRSKNTDQVNNAISRCSESIQFISPTSWRLRLRWRCSKSLRQSLLNFILSPRRFIWPRWVCIIWRSFGLMKRARIVSACKPSGWPTSGMADDIQFRDVHASEGRGWLFSDIFSSLLTTQRLHAEYLS